MPALVWVHPIRSEFDEPHPRQSTVLTSQDSASSVLVKDYKEDWTGAYGLRSYLTALSERHSEPRIDEHRQLASCKIVSWCGQQEVRCSRKRTRAREQSSDLGNDRRRIPKYGAAAANLQPIHSSSRPPCVLCGKQSIIPHSSGASCGREG